jgi:hypothetical protein
MAEHQKPRTPSHHSKRYWKRHPDRVPRSQQGTKQEADKPRKLFTTTDLLLLVVLPIVGLVLAFIGLVEMFPIYVNLAVYITGLIAIEIAVWRWERTVTWAVPYRLLVFVGVATLYGGALANPVTKQYQRENDMALIFKDDELFTWWKKWEVQRQYIKMRDYFLDLGIAVPKETPPIYVNHLSAEYETMAFGDPAYRGELGISEHSFITDNKQGIGETYANYVISALILPKPPAPADDKAGTDFRLFEIFSAYFVSSCWDNRNSNISDWSGQLWNVREQLGKEFTDRLAAYTFRSFVDSPNEGQGNHFSVYFCNHLRIGYSVLRSDDRKWQDVLHAMTPEYASSCPAH